MVPRPVQSLSNILHTYLPPPQPSHATPPPPPPPLCTTGTDCTECSINVRQKKLGWFKADRTGCSDYLSLIIRWGGGRGESELSGFHEDFHWWLLVTAGDCWWLFGLNFLYFLYFGVSQPPRAAPAHVQSVQSVQSHFLPGWKSSKLSGRPRQEWSTLIGPDLSRYCSLIGGTLTCWLQSLCLYAITTHIKASKMPLLDTKDLW